MRLTAYTDFGLRILMRLAGTPGSVFTTADISRELGLSTNHLSKIVRELARAGILRTRRGASGGFELARDPRLVTLGEIVRLLENRQPLVECFREDGGNCTLMPGCGLRRRLAAANEAFLRELDQTTLAECAYRPASA